MAALAHPELRDVTLAAVLHALSDPTRLEVVRQLSQGRGELSCCEIGIEQAKATLSHHFKVLRAAGLIRVRVEGTQRFNSLRTEEIEARFPGLLTSVLKALEHGDAAPVKRAARRRSVRASSRR